MPVLTFSAQLDQNLAIVEEHPDGLKATAYFEDYLFKLFQDIENINVIAGLAYGVIEVTGQPTLSADIATDTLEFIDGVSISITTAVGAPDAITITNDDPFPEAPIDGNPYGRRDAGWVDLNTLFIPDAPIDGNIYGRLNGAWANIDTFGLDHGGLSGLADDDHLQYLLLAGRSGGQAAFGGLLAGETLDLQANPVNTGASLINVLSPIVFGPYSQTTALYGFTYNPSETFTGVFIGGGMNFSGTIDFSFSTFIYESFRGSPRINTGVVPGFAAYTVLQSLPLLSAGATAGFNPLAPLVLNAGPTCENDFTGTKSTATMLVINGAMQVRTGLFGAVMNITNFTGLQWAPKFSTVAGSSVSFGTIRGLWCQNPAVALFQPAAGTEAMTAYIGFEQAAVPFGGNVTKRALRSALTLASNTLMIENTGGADSDFGAGDIHFNDNAGIFFGNTVAAADLLLFWNSTTSALRFSPFFGTGGNPLDLVGTGADVWIFQQDLVGFGAIGVQFNVGAIAFGTVAPTPGAVDFYVRFASPSLRTPSAGASDYRDVEWNAAGALDVNGETLTDFDGFHIAAPAVLLSGGSIADMSNMHVDSMSSFGATRIQALRVTGRTRIDGLFTFNEATLTQLTANVAALSLPPNNAGRYILLQDADNLGPWDIQGIVNVQVGDSVVFVNDGANAWRFTHQDAAAAAADRIITPTGVAYVVGADETACLWYDPVATRWRILWGTGA